MKKYLRDKKNNLIIVFLVLFSILICFILYLLGFFGNNKKFSKNIKNDVVSKDIKLDNIIEKTIDFKDLKTFNQEMKTQYPSAGNILYKNIKPESYLHSFNQNDFGSLIIVKDGYSVSNMIKGSPKLIFIPEIIQDILIGKGTDNEGKYFDVDLDLLKQYCQEKNKKIYIVNINNFPSNQINQTSLGDNTNNNISGHFSQEEDDITIEKKLDKLDDLLEDPDFKYIYQNYSYYNLTNVVVYSDAFQALQKPDVNVVLIAKEVNYCKSTVCSSSLDHKDIIFIILNEDDLNHNRFKETTDNNNSIFNKRYDELTYDEIRNLKRKKYIFTIKNYDIEQNNPKLLQMVE